MAHSQHHQHWSGYNSTVGYFSNGTYHPGVGTGRRSPAKSPIVLSPISPPTLSCSPREEGKGGHNNHVSSSPGGHASRKIDNIFRHLVKWGSPHHHKDKESKSSRASPTSAATISNSKASSSSKPIAVNYKPSYQYNYGDSPEPRGRGYFDDDDEEEEEHNDEYHEEDPHSTAQNRGRSKSLDVVTTRYNLRRRRFSENIPTRAQDTSQTQRTYTIYESIIRDGSYLSLIYVFKLPSR
jgi:hypothetical protein